MHTHAHKRFSRSKVYHDSFETGSVVLESSETAVWVCVWVYFLHLYHWAHTHSWVPSHLTNSCCWGLFSRLNIKLSNTYLLELIQTRDYSIVSVRSTSSIIIAIRLIMTSTLKAAEKVAFYHLWPINTNISSCSGPHNKDAKQAEKSNIQRQEMPVGGGISADKQ